MVAVYRTRYIIWIKCLQTNKQRKYKGMINFISFDDATSQFIAIEANKVFYATSEKKQNAFDEVFLFDHSYSSIQKSWTIISYLRFEHG